MKTVLIYSALFTEIISTFEHLLSSMNFIKKKCWPNLNIRLWAECIIWHLITVIGTVSVLQFHSKSVSFILFETRDKLDRDA